MMSASARAVFAILIATSSVSSVGCGGRGAASALDEVNQTRASEAAKEAHALAPQAYDHAEDERARAEAAVKAGDEASARIYAERAIAAYQHALVLARLARATRDQADAEAALAQAVEQARSLAVSRAAVEREGKDLETQLKVARDAIAPPTSSPTDPQRENARYVAARSLAMQAHLLCGSARLIDPKAAGLDALDTEVAALDAKLDAAAGPAPIDATARARAGCLAALTTARRASPGSGSGQADTLLSELSAAAGWEPVRDERGVVVALHDAWKGTALTKEAETKLTELGHVAAAHPAFAIQLVVHDATAPSAAEVTNDRARGDAAMHAIVAGGADAARTKVELAKARAPVVDPRNATLKGRNGRLEVVFVAPGN